MKKSSKIPGKNKIHREKRSSSPETENDDISLWHEPFVHVVFIIAAGFFVYFNTVTTPFLFDDYLYLVNNPAIKDFSYFADTDRILNLGINPDIKNNFILRPVSYFTFALNYALHGLDVRGYHVANLIIHIGNALLVYLLLSLSLQTPAMAADEQEKSDSPAVKLRYLPLFCALLFACHPLQTQAVTYIIQRFTPLVTLFYLGSLVLYVKGRLGATTTARTACYVISVIAAILAMKTKENAFTLPVIITLFEFIFFYGSIGKRIARLVPFLLTMAIIPVDLMELSSLAKPDESDAIIDSINLVNFRSVSPWDYLMTQFGVITTYLRLLVMPIGQNFDYDYPLQKNFFSSAVLMPLGFLLLILGTGIYVLYRSRDRRLPERHLFKIIAFGICWFFITLSVESSIIPIDDLIFEHRAYLPSIGFFMSIIAGIASLYSHRTGKSFFASKVALRTLSAVILCLSAAGMARNTIWADSVTFWSDVARKSPKKSRVHTNLGIALFEQGKTGAGIEEFRTAIRLKPSDTNARINLGKSLLIQKMYDEAASELLTAARLNPHDPVPHVFLGLVYEGKGELSNARWAYLAAIKISPASPDAHIRLGELYAKEEKIQDAKREYEAALRLYPDEIIRKKIVELNRMQDKR
ncbi:tetratricopeptide repeat protein [Geotalea uraniireducens]|uniref:Tetratricopeptide TPR_2 repeat protein n=1 Tax=Geotalea uraniireducens (strain Rf4) TaxID=351605 RepID=A5GA75_GEOUR|nr:tetratricopeptide repeat protein [Geotalea uraniireducens]ABQ25522.1 Tetratricopeptide TPR_2 repeat protein [Geotalea uraniireducens Rf4]